MIELYQVVVNYLSEPVTISRGFGIITSLWAVLGIVCGYDMVRRRNKK